MLGGGLVLVGVVGLAWVASGQGRPWRMAQMMGPGGGMMGSGMGPGMGPGMMGRGSAPASGKTTFASNGERIYYTGVSATTGTIPRSGGPMWVEMGGTGCFACHGIEGRGGVPVMMGTALPADIRYAALITGEYEHGKKETPYTDPLIRRAITEGLDPDGKPLDWTMPRWQMPPQDLTDLLTYLKTLR